eukprot:COSAG01_NODE_519_length_16012_cov_4.344058_3_plen_159_part_00
MIAWLSFFITLVLHVLLFFIALPVIIPPEKPSKQQPIQAIQLSFYQTAKVQTSKNGIASKKKVKWLPGDRKKALLSVKATPTYPKKALNLDWSGKIIVKANINTKGRVSHVNIIKSTGHQLLDQSFIRTLYEQYRFKPKRVLGKNISSFLKLSYDFEL